MPHIVISTDKAKLDLGYIHGFLTTSYWAEGIPRSVVARSIAHSLCFGLYKHARQIGFARVVTDYATFAYLADVFVDPDEQHQGYGSRLLAAVLSHADLQGLRRWHLVTKDAQPFYRQMAFSVVARPENHMEKYAQPDYGGAAAGGGDAKRGRHDS